MSYRFYILDEDASASEGPFDSEEEALDRAVEVAAEDGYFSLGFLLKIDSEDGELMEVKKIRGRTE